ncbi:hypothetical protein Q3G72_007588 [Acer saccharum]|nr:hypothetical protein Q3G72_007588 [Acer saccharum]
MQRDVKRVAALTHLLSPAKSYEVENLGTDLVSDYSMGFSEYLVRVGIGSPPTYQYLAMDTNTVKAPNVDCILNCGQESITVSLSNAEGYLHLPTVNSKLDRFSLSRNLPSAVNFAKSNISRGKALLVCCRSGKDFYMSSFLDE